MASDPDPTSSSIWLMKSEPDVFSIEDLHTRPKQTELWDGVRNYQARNFMRDSMKVGHQVLFYHSNCPTPGIVGLAEVSGKAVADPTQFDPASDYYDPKSTPDNPRWLALDIRWKETFAKTISLKTLKEQKILSTMRILARGNRLSITPVTETEFRHILSLI